MDQYKGILLTGIVTASIAISGSYIAQTNSITELYTNQANIQKSLNDTKTIGESMRTQSILTGAAIDEMRRSIDQQAEALVILTEVNQRVYHLEYRVDAFMGKLESDKPK